LKHNFFDNMTNSQIMEEYASKLIVISTKNSKIISFLAQFSKMKSCIVGTAF
jgi:hypothetical protein